ncbi:MAG: response regulator [Chloroflexi bacterium]|nr:response regulator [Chloroflexota bacterium]
MRIVCVEDNEINLFLVRRIASMGGHEVIHYNNGWSVLEHFESDRPDLLLIDVQIVGTLDGLDVVRVLRAGGHQTPIFALTAHAMMGDRERCLEAGCTGYLAKPLPVADLVELFSRYAELTRRKPEIGQA